MPVLSNEEKNVLNWLKLYGPLSREQLTRLLNIENPKVTENIFRRLRMNRLIENINGGYYIGINKFDKADPKTIQAMWVFLYFSGDVEPNHHRSGDFPGQIFFIKENWEYQIVVVDDGLEFQLTLLNKTDANRKHIIVVSDFSKIDKVKPYLPDTPCVFATLTYENGVSEPIVRFALPEEANTNG